MCFYSSSSFETNHIYDVKNGVDHANPSTNVTKQLIKMSKRFRSVNLCDVLAHRRRELGGRTASSVATPSTAPTDMSCYGDRWSNTEATGMAAGSSATDMGRLQPARGISFARFVNNSLYPAIGDAFIKRLAYYLSDILGLFGEQKDRPRFRNLAEGLAWERSRQITIDTKRIMFYTSLRVSAKKDVHGSRKYAFTLVASPRYRGQRRYDTLFVKSGEPAPYVGQLCNFLTYLHEGKLHHLVYLRFFERVVAPEHTAAGYHLPYTRLRLQESPLDFVSLSSVVEPAHVVPNFDTAVMPTRALTHTIPLTAQYSEFWLNEFHFPTAL